MERCLLCLSDENGYGHDLNTNLGELCSKFLHSAFTQGNFSNQAKSEPFCTKCQDSLLQLGCLSEQLDFVHKSISELILTFSLEILHRRGRRSDYEETPKKRLVEFDVSQLPECHSWKRVSHANSIKSFAINSDSVVAPENIYDENTEDPLAFSSLVGNDAIDIEEIKTETNWSDDNIIYFESDDNYIAAFPTQLEKTPGNLEYQSDTYNQTQAPILKIQKLKFKGIGRKSVEVESRDEDGKGNKSVVTTIWTKKNPRGSYRIKKQNLSRRLDNLRDESSVQFNMTTDITASSSAPCSERQSGQKKQTPGISFNPSEYKVAKNKSLICKKFKQPEDEVSTSPECTRTMKKETYSSHQCHICKNIFSSTPSLRRHQLIHSGALPFKCDVCSKRFRYKHNMTTHRRLHTGERPYQCHLCPKTFPRSDNFKLHFTNYHQKGGKYENIATSNQ